MNIKKFDVLLASIILVAIAIFIYKRFDTEQISSAEIENTLLSSRYNSYRQAGIVNGRNWIPLEAKNAITDEPILIGAETRLIMLLSNSGCNPCQLRELKNMNILMEKHLPKEEFDFAAIYLNRENEDAAAKTNALLLRKLSLSKVPIYYHSGDRSSIFSSINRYPVYVLVRKGVVVSSFYPVPEDDMFSDEFIDSIDQTIVSFTKE